MWLEAVLAVINVARFKTEDIKGQQDGEARVLRIPAPTSQSCTSSFPVLQEVVCAGDSPSLSILVGSDESIIHRFS